MFKSVEIIAYFFQINNFNNQLKNINKIKDKKREMWYNLKNGGF